MNVPTDNLPPPCDVGDFIKSLTSIGGLTDSGYPHLRIIWGQARSGPLSSLYTMNGEHHLKYRHHVKKTELFALPVCALDGKIVDYDVYESTDVIPADGRVIGQLTMSEDIGVPRWFIEQAWAIDPDEWNYQRQMAVARQDDDPGSCPEGSLVYEEMYCVAVHNQCCDAEGMTPQKKKCRGEYRQPGEIDLQVLRSTEARMRATEGWTGNLGWRNPALAVEVAKAVKDHRERDANQAEQDAQELEYLIASQLKPHSRRLTDEGSGLDWEKYKFVPSSYKRIRQKKQRGKHAATDANIQ